MKFTYDPNLYELEDCTCLAKFDGVAPFDSSKSKDPQVASYGPSVQWSFTVVHGENKGKVGSVITAARPSKKNSCLRMIAAILGNIPKELDEIDMDHFKGNYYAITIIDGRLSHQFTPRLMGSTFDQALRSYDPEYAASAPHSTEPVPF